MPHAVVDISTRMLLVAAFVVMLGGLAMFGGTFYALSDSQPQILEGNFVDDGGSGLFAVAESQSCSTDGDCPSTTCNGDNYLVDTDGDVSCIDYDGDGSTECSGYDKTYADAEYCGGRYDYNCDSSGCEGYKAACEDDCSANSGCDTYDFCGDDDDDDSSSGGSSGGDDTSSCTDACESLTKKCSGGNVVQCQDTDSDSCTDGFVEIASCDGSCENAACVTPTDTDEDTGENNEDTANETEPESGTQPDGQTFTERIAEAWTNVWTTLFGWI